MNNTLHILFKFPNEKFKKAGISTNTLLEHYKTFSKYNRVIWGQSSKNDRRGISEKNRGRILNNQIDNGKDTYAFFLANSKGNRELYVGKISNVYERQGIPSGHSLTHYIPDYYSSKIGNQDDNISIFVDLSSFFKIDYKYIERITIESSGAKIPFINNTTPIFLINIDEVLTSLLNETSLNSEVDFQYQVEQEEIPNIAKINDQPKKAKLKKMNGALSSYRRDPAISKKAILIADYKCELDFNHQHFVSKVTKKNYVEAHHLIPMEFQHEFMTSIDVEANIVSLCANCHKKLHHADFEVIKPLIEKLYDLRTVRLEKCNIHLTKEKLFYYYN